MNTGHAPHIVIEDLPVLENLSEEELAQDSWGGPQGHPSPPGLSVAGNPPDVRRRHFSTVAESCLDDPNQRRREHDSSLRAEQQRLGNGQWECRQDNVQRIDAFRRVTRSDLLRRRDAAAGCRKRRTSCDGERQFPGDAGFGNELFQVLGHSSSCRKPTLRQRRLQLCEACCSQASPLKSSLASISGLRCSNRRTPPVRRCNSTT